MVGDRQDRRTLLVALLLVASTVGWRRGQYFSGSLDPVVLAKGVLSLVAVALAAGAARRVARRPLGAGSLCRLGLFLALSVFGALTYGGLLASAMVGVRVAVLAATVFLLLRAVPLASVLSAVATASGAVAAVAAATGLPSLAATGRLDGGLPPLAPNELALLASIVVLHQGWRAVEAGLHWRGATTAVAFLAVIWATGSRTALLVLLAALLIGALHVRRPRAGVVAGGLVAAGATLAAVLGTGAASAFLERDGSGTSTLQSRFIAWDAARSWAPHLWQTVFGGGLSVKIIHVDAQWWSQQPLDSSWVSAFVQAGLLGLLVTVAWVLWVLRNALRAPRDLRLLVLPLLVYVVGRGFLESGLFDATPAFLVFFAVSLAVEPGSRPPDDRGLLPGPDADVLVRPSPFRPPVPRAPQSTVV